jgi:hypothetical protein
MWHKSCILKSKFGNWINSLVHVGKISNGRRGIEQGEN